ncbi:hypothetical protein HY413_03620 [Candidatus Kaiserbacteria bacterium]|nr:hypothetical protein [Candidatus Kaiserbacteria bacterium]
MHGLIVGHKMFNTFAGLIFLLAGLLHATRAFYMWDMSINGWMVPIWLSWVAAFIALTLAYNAFVALK